MKNYIMCDYCPNLVDEEDTACSHCGRPMYTDNPLIKVCNQVGIPVTMVQNNKVCPIVRIQITAEGLDIDYLEPGQIVPHTTEVTH